MEAVAGPMADTKLPPTFLEHTTWGELHALHPTTLLLSTKTGSLFRDYDRKPYGDYAESADLIFDVEHVDLRYPTNEWVLGIEIDGTFKASPFSELEKTTQPLTDNVNGKQLQLYFNVRANSAPITDLHGKPTTHR